MSGFSARPRLLHESDQLTYPSGSLVTWAHGLGRLPLAGRFGFYLVWKGGSSAGFTNGMIIPASLVSAFSAGITLTADMANLRLAVLDSVAIVAANASTTVSLSSSNVNAVLWVEK